MSEDMPIDVIDLDFFNVQVGVFRGHEEFIKHMGPKGIEADAGHRGVGEARWDECDAGKLWFSIILTDAATTQTVVHECVHMADFVMDRLGIPTDITNTEIRAYLTAYLFWCISEREGPET